MLQLFSISGPEFEEAIQPLEVLCSKYRSLLPVNLTFRFRIDLRRVGYSRCIYNCYQ